VPSLVEIGPVVLEKIKNVKSLRLQLRQQRTNFDQKSSLEGSGELKIITENKII
jgi:hypothetical protein